MTEEFVYRALFSDTLLHVLLEHLAAWAEARRKEVVVDCVVIEEDDGGWSAAVYYLEAKS